MIKKSNVIYSKSSIFDNIAVIRKKISAKGFELFEVLKNAC